MDAKTPYIVVIVIRVIYVGMFLLSKAALNGGMNIFIFSFYRQTFATIFLLPLAIIFERKKAPPLNLAVFCKIFMLSLFGVTISFNIYGIALDYTTATFVAATTNSLPVITFLLAVLLRMETVKLRSLSGATKIFGVIVCSAGVSMLAFYEGPHLKPLMHHNLFGQQSVKGHPVSHSSGKRVQGCFLMLAANILWGLWFVLQGRVIESYPSKLLFTTLQCSLSALQSFVIAIAFERNTDAWKLHLDVGLLAVAYSGIVVTGVSFYLQAWCIMKKGPVFLSMSTPLSFILTILCSVLFLGEMISMGSVVGGIFLVIGLYSVLWGKSREQKEGKLVVEEGKNGERRNENVVSEDEKRHGEIV